MIRDLKEPVEYFLDKTLANSGLILVFVFKIWNDCDVDTHTISLTVGLFLVVNKTALHLTVNRLVRGFAARLTNKTGA